METQERKFREPAAILAHGLARAACAFQLPQDHASEQYRTAKIPNYLHARPPCLRGGLKPQSPTLCQADLAHLHGYTAGGRRPYDYDLGSRLLAYTSKPRKGIPMFKKAEKVIADQLAKDSASVKASMARDGFLPCNGDDMTEEDGLDFFAQIDQGRLAKATVFAREDAALALMVSMRTRADVVVGIKACQFLLWIVIFWLGYVAAKL